MRRMFPGRPSSVVHGTLIVVRSRIVSEKSIANRGGVGVGRGFRASRPAGGPTWDSRNLPALRGQGSAITDSGTAPRRAGRRLVDLQLHTNRHWFRARFHGSSGDGDVHV